MKLLWDRHCTAFCSNTTIKISIIYLCTSTYIYIYRYTYCTLREIRIILPSFFPRDYEIDRSLVELREIIGEGQFGDVHKGVYGRDGTSEGLAVAVKTCKVEGDAAMTEKFLEEACE